MRIAVGLSGGVDSAISACLLRREGHDVIGLTMKIWDGSLPMKDEGRSGCFGPGEYRDIESAKSVARRLGIEHHVVDLSSDYNKEILSYFRDEYRSGRTPNPCVRCNKRMKFGLLIERSREQGISFDCFATGHYARVEFDENTKRYVLKKGIDPAKDQSYFLSRLTQEQLRELRFPLGSVTKEEVRSIAISEGWADLAEKPESQDFIEASDYSVLFKDEDLSPGAIVDEQGKVLGVHKGIVNYTIGQRKGLCGGASEPLYVVGIDAEKNLVKVGGRNSLYSKCLRATDLNWVSIDSLSSDGVRAVAKIRQQHKGAEAFVLPDRDSSDGEAVMVDFDEAQASVTPGQAVVFYAEDTVIGSGIIASA